MHILFKVIAHHAFYNENNENNITEYDIKWLQLFLNFHLRTEMLSLKSSIAVFDFGHMR